MDKDFYEIPQPKPHSTERPAKDYAPQFDAIVSNAFHRRGPNRRGGVKLAAWLLASVLTDIFILVGLTVLFLIAGSVSFNGHFKPSMQTALLIYGFVSWVYFILLRLFLGATVGEWSCGMRIGQPYERMQVAYPVKIIFRVALITLTGVCVLPLLSLIFKKDIAGKICKASLYSLK